MKGWSNSEIPAAGAHVPEKRLLAAVLQRAITDYVSGEGELKEGARSWLMEDEPSDAPLTFKFICEALDLDYESLKSAILMQAETAQQDAVQEIAL
ncbi:MAG: hypothetical protein GYA55_00170 [SAR324 cluster bacterium]|uniref:Uncharacterized protein n=1 Tax=SAR324 cluster bacterium TaxID=2024889 RepID=A0A7X9IJ02_9DELT|nr:hypothetical protein [SAR324 cluster bacterium]